jgi:hypothetical protein
MKLKGQLKVESKLGKRAGQKEIDNFKMSLFLKIKKLVGMKHESKYKSIFGFHQK